MQYSKGWEMDIKNELVDELGEILDTDSIEAATEDVSLDINEIDEDLHKSAKKMKKHHKAKVLVEEAKGIVKVAEEQTEECRLLLEGDLKEYETAVEALRSGGMDQSESLLGELNFEVTHDDIDMDDVVGFDTNEDDSEPIFVKDVTSGIFSGFFLSLLGGLATLAGLAYYAISKLGLDFNLGNIFSNETLQSVFKWFAGAIGRPDDVMNGGLLVAAITLAVMALIYMVRVALKGNKNLHFATRQLEDAQTYVSKKKNCKDEMEKVDEHIHDAIATLKTYQVLFDEQKGKLNRILHVEGQKEATSDYHHKSIEEMQETQKLLDAVKGFMEKPMSSAGKLSDTSVLFLHRAKSKIEKMIERLY